MHELLRQNTQPRWLIATTTIILFGLASGCSPSGDDQAAAEDQAAMDHPAEGIVATTFAATGAIATCGATTIVNGGDSGYNGALELGATRGLFNLHYDTQSIKDRVIVSYEGRRIFDSGCVGQAKTVTLSISGQSSQVHVNVVPNCAGSSGTAWSFRVTCPAGGACSSASDCASGVCTDGVCQSPTCDDGVKNQGETDLDCGGASAFANACIGCAAGRQCNHALDCLSYSCVGGTCASPTCSDGVHNGNETAVDCGGACPACNTCSNGAWDKAAGETDLDCGGPCPKCENGRTCNTGGDCQSGTCKEKEVLALSLDGGSVFSSEEPYEPTTELSCSDPSCGDGVQNGDETGIDCGGSLCAPCLAGRLEKHLTQMDPEVTGTVGSNDLASGASQIQLRPFELMGTSPTVGPPPAPGNGRPRLSAMIAGSLSAPSDVDHYRFTVDVPGSDVLIQIKTAQDDCPPQLDAVLELYNAAGTLLAQAIRPAPGSCTTIRPGTHAGARNLPIGEYHVRLSFASASTVPRAAYLVGIVVLQSSVEISTALQKWCSTSTSQIVAGDINGDRRADLVCNDYHNYTALWQTTQSAFVPVNANAGLSLPSWCYGRNARVLVADVNGDRAADLVCNDGTNGNNFVALWSPSTSSFVPVNANAGFVSSQWCYGATSRIALADVNGDKRADLICNDSTTGGNWVALWSPTQSTFVPVNASQGLALSGWCGGPTSRWAVADFDGDASADLVCNDGTNAWNYVARWNAATLQFVPINAQAGLAMQTSWCGGPTTTIKLADMDGDGRADLICSQSSSGRLWVARATQTGFEPVNTSGGLVLSSFCSGASARLLVADVNDDQRADLMCNDSGTGVTKVAVLNGSQYPQ